MSAAQAVFLVGLSAIVVVIVAFTGLVLASARVSDGGARIGGRLLRRMGHSASHRAELNRWAFYLHRLSGFAVFAFLALHIVDVSLFSFSESLYDNVHALYANPVMRVLECGLVFAVLFHTLNGLRLLAVDLADVGMARATVLLGGVAALTTGLGVTGCVYILGPVL
jgi:succinate dehydrogenase / fumarate reductase cytochrome b subunit